MRRFSLAADASLINNERRRGNEEIDDGMLFGSIAFVHICRRAGNNGRDGAIGESLEREGLCLVQGDGRHRCGGQGEGACYVAQGDGDGQRRERDIYGHEPVRRHEPCGGDAFCRMGHGSRRTFAEIVQCRVHCLVREDACALLRCRSFGRGERVKLSCHLSHNAAKRRIQ